MDMELNEAILRMILSASGWRGIFAENGDEENSAAEISEAHKLIVAAAARVFSDYLLNAAPGKSAVIVGRDTRPTGKAIADAAIRSLLAAGREVLYTGVAAAPELMAFARASGNSAAGFMYISASHNPIGHNGIKFGLSDGGVLQAEENAKLVSAFKALVSSPEGIEKAFLEGLADGKLAAVYAAADGYKKAAMGAYWGFSCEVVSGLKDRAEREEFFAVLRKGLEKRPLAVAADFNGSARTLSIDRDFFSSLGVKFYALNDIPGRIAHRIVPEGEALEPCRAFVEELHCKDPSLVLGYVPDCDGDRGNLVFYDEGEQRARVLEAQEVFALACVAELSCMAWAGELKFDSQGRALTKAAIAVNDPTSLRIDRIARAFGVDVFRAEVGEANVVGLARRLREQGYMVRILGEGSAGGTIIHPSAVRDPIDTVCAILKLLAIRSGSGKEDCPNQGPFEIWHRLSGQAGAYREDFALADIIASLPAFVTTGSYSEEALLKVKTGDHGALKERYQEIFMREWEEKKETLRERYGISGWEAIAYNGMEERRGISRFGEAGRGGLKIEFSGIGGAEGRGESRREDKSACIWMRGSGTEAVFRVMADAPDTGLERFLIGWQRQMVLEADNG